MAQTDAQHLAAARRIATEMFNGGVKATANLNLDDLKAAIASIDTAMNTVISTIPAGWQAKSIKQALIDNLPEPFQTNSTAAQKALALQIWAEAEVGA